MCELPDGQDAFVHFSDIEAAGYRALEAGDGVDFDYEAARQDSFNFRATRARRLESDPGASPAADRDARRHCAGRHARHPR